MFRRLIFSAILIGIFSGVILSVVQHFTVTPIILEAELFEQAEPAVSHQHAGETSESHEEWGPDDGLERTGYTMGANILAGIGFASLLLVVLSQLTLHQKISLSVKQGVITGLLAYAVFFAIPSLGLPPEIPGASADLLENRQSWWLMSVIGSALGVLILVFAPLPYKLIGLVSVLIPFIIGAPHFDGVMFNHPDLQAVASLNALHQQFLVATGVSNLIFWLVLGVSSTVLLKGWVYRQRQNSISHD